MDYRQDIGFGGASVAGQAIAAQVSTRVDASAAPQVVETPAVTSAGAGSSSSGSSYGQGESFDGRLNPQTVLDPDLYVNVAQFSYDQGAFEFQVPSRTQIEAYRQGQDAGEEQVEVQERQVVETSVTEREVADADGVGDFGTQATGTVTAAAVSQATTQGQSPTGATPPRDDPSNRQTTTTTAPRHAVELEA